MSTIRCEKCNITFSKPSNLKRHAKNKHQVEIINLKKKQDSSSSKGSAFILKCGICDLETTKQLLDIHYVDIHKIDLSAENIRFTNINAFLEWKISVEKEHNCKFISLCGRKKNIERYVCHRTGQFKSKSRGLRSLKKQGSKKIGSYCPAKMTIHIDNEICDVKFIKTHVGHENEPHHVTLTHDVRAKIAHKLSQKIPPAVIIDEIKSSLAHSNDRIHLLTMKDLHNISKEFRISFDSPDKNNSTLDNFLEELRTEESPIVHYKPAGNIDCYGHFKPDDFILILMNRTQIEFLKKFGKAVIIFDRTSKVSFDLHLFIMIVLNDMQQALPCCFFLCNREDESALRGVFSILRERIGLLETDILMSYTHDQCYKAWLSVMSVPKYHLFNSWNINQAWKNNLVKIKDEKKQEEVRSMLKDLLSEFSTKKFPILLNELVGKITGQEETRSFGLYFCKYFLRNVDKWAQCYRSRLGLNNLAEFEKICKIIKCIYFTTKKNGGLNHFLLFLFRFLRDKLFSASLSYEEKNTMVTENLKNNHSVLDSAAYFITEGDVENVWLITSVNEKIVFEVKYLNSDCQCELICEKCETCVHSYVCSCLESSMNWNMCCHVHYLCMNKNKNNSNSEVMVISNSLAPDENEYLNYLTDDGYIEECNSKSELIAEDVPENYSKINAVSRINSLMDEIIFHMDSDDDSNFVLSNLERMAWYLKTKNTTVTGRIENVIIK